VKTRLLGRTSRGSIQGDDGVALGEEKEMKRGAGSVREEPDSAADLVPARGHAKHTWTLYFAVPQENPPPPNAEYKAQIIRAAKHWQLPLEYIRELEGIETA